MPPESPNVARHGSGRSRGTAITARTALPHRLGRRHSRPAAADLQDHEPSHLMHSGDSQLVVTSFRRMITKIAGMEDRGTPENRARRREQQRRQQAQRTRTTKDRSIRRRPEAGPSGGPPRRPAAGAAGRSPREPGTRCRNGVRRLAGTAPGSKHALRPPAGRQCRSLNGACKSPCGSQSPAATGLRPSPSWLRSSMTAGSTTVALAACHLPSTPSWPRAGTTSASAPRGTVPSGALETEFADTFAGDSGRLQDHRTSSTAPRTRGTTASSRFPPVLVR